MAGVCHRNRRWAKERIWFFSPALATALFFAAKLVLTVSADAPAEEPLAAAAADTPVASPVEVRVVAEIRAAERQPDRGQPVPATESALLRLFERDGAVTFYADEVEVVATPAREFDAQEVRVIRPSRAEE